MALSTREAMLLGIGGILGVVVLGGYFLVMPAYDQFMVKWNQNQQLDNVIASLETQEVQLKNEIQRYADQPDPLEEKEVAIRRYEVGEREANLKQMVNTLVEIADASTSSFIGLKPMDVSPLVITVDGPSGGDTDVDEASGAEAEEEEKVHINVDTFGYEFAVRGTYRDVTDFIAGLNTVEEVMEISDIELMNEAGRDRQEKSTGSSKSLLDPTKPIKLTANLKIFMLPKNLQVQGL